MKKIFTLSAITLLSAILLVGCSKRGYDYGYSEDYWLSRESGVVVYSDGYCPYYVIETYNGYTIVDAGNGAYSPYEGDIIYGDLSRRGYRDFYNRSTRSLISGRVTDYWLSYGEAQYLIDNLCYTYGKGVEKKKIKQAGLSKK